MSLYRFFPDRFGGLNSLKNGAAMGMVFLVCACAEVQLTSHVLKTMGDHDAAAPTYKVGDPYHIDGLWYYPKVDYHYDETGYASWYGPKFHGRPTANGERFDMNMVSAAHKTLPMPSFVRVTNLENGRALTVRINDRGPFVRGRIIDMSRRGAELLGFKKQGTARVRVTILPELSKQAANADTTPLVKAAQDSRHTDMKSTGLGLTDLRSTDLGSTSLKPTAKTQLYVQAGAFADAGNATRLRHALDVFGPTEITHVEIDARSFYRVRIGPLNTPAEAEKILKRMLESGYSDAQIANLE